MLLRLWILISMLAGTLAGSPAYPQSSPGGANLPAVRGCEDQLLYRRLDTQAGQLARAFSSFRIQPLPDFFGFEIQPVLRTSASPDREILLRNLAHGPEEWLTERWQIQDRDLAFFDIGFNNLELDARELDHILLFHLQNERGRGLKIEYGLERMKAMLELSRFRWIVHSHVLKTYESEKPYLTPEDFEVLSTVNRNSTNYDVFALLDYDPKFRWKMWDEDEIRSRLRATIQISYFGDRDYFKPTWRGILRSAGLASASEAMDSLPFESRLTREFRMLVRRELYTTFDTKTVCEVTRYAKFVNDLPLNVSDRLILQVMKRVREKGMKAVIVAADPKTIRLFRRYGVRPYWEIPVPEGHEKEFIGLLEVDSPEFNAIFAKLEASASAVRAEKVVYR